MKKFFLSKLNWFKCFPFFILFLLLVFSADSALAHRVVLFAWTEGDMVFTQSQFPDGRKIADGQVNVFDRDNNLLLAGKTDANGEYSFKIPKITDLNIILDAGMGHQGQWNLSEDEIKSSVGADNREPEAENSDTQTDMTETTENNPSGSLVLKDDLKTDEKTVLLNEKQLEQMIEKVLDKKLQPINRMLARMQSKGPSVNDIFGGIGYILGLMGVAAFFLSKKKNN